MHKFSTSVLSLCACVALSVPALAQTTSSVPVLAGETALQYAQRIDACNGQEVLSAEFGAGILGSMVVSCRPKAANANLQNRGLTGGLGAVGIAGLPLIVLVALVGDSSTSTTSTTGTN